MSAAFERLFDARAAASRRARSTLASARIDQTRALIPDNDATTLQVAAPLVVGLRWAISHPREGILEPDDLPHDEMPEFAAPYLGELAGAYADWTPLEGADRLFDERLDFSDPWQCSNVRVYGPAVAQDLRLARPSPPSLPPVRRVFCR